MADEIAEYFYYLHLQDCTDPKVHLVDFPSTCADLIDEPFISRIERTYRELCENGYVSDDLEQLLTAQCPGREMQPNPCEAHGKGFERLKNSIQTMSRDKYASMLRPGEVEEEEWR